MVPFTLYSGPFSLTPFLFLLNLCVRIRSRKRVLQTKQWRKRSQDKATLLGTDSHVHLPTGSDKGPALPKANKWPLGRQTQETVLLVVIVLWRMMLFAMKKIQHRPQRLFKKKQPTFKFQSVGHLSSLNLTVSYRLPPHVL
jgi:hypothetical protein